MEGNSVFSIAACGAGGQPPQSFLGADDGKPVIRVYLLPAGGYFVLGPSGGSTLTLAALPSQTWVTSSCGSPRSDPPWANLEGTLKFTLPTGTWHIPLAWSPPSPIFVVPYQAGSTAAVCPDCQSTAACADASLSAPYSATVGGTPILRVVSVPDADSEYSETLVMGM